MLFQGNINKAKLVFSFSWEHALLMPTSFPLSVFPPLYPPNLDTFFFPDNLSLLILDYLKLSFSVMPSQMTSAYNDYSSKLLDTLFSVLLAWVLNLMCNSSLGKYLLNTYYVPGTVLCHRDKMLLDGDFEVNFFFQWESSVLCLWSVYFLWVWWLEDRAASVKSTGSTDLLQCQSPSIQATV